MQIWWVCLWRWTQLLLLDDRVVRKHRRSHLSLAVPSMRLCFVVHSGLFLQLWTTKHKLATYKKGKPFCTVKENVYLFLDLLDNRFGPVSSVCVWWGGGGQKRIKRENKVIEFVVDVYKVATLNIFDIKLTIITISDEFGQLSFCSLLFLGFFPWPSLDPIGRIQFPTHDSKYTNSLQMERKANLYAYTPNK